MITKYYCKSSIVRVALLLALTGLAPLFSSSAPAADGQELKLDVVADLGALDVIPSPTFGGQGPFFIPGTIHAAGTTTVIGRFRCWGFFIRGGSAAVVSQEYALTGLGKIQVQGVEDQGPRAVTGGTGVFDNVRGEMTGANLSNFPSFTVTFKLKGAPSK